ncbi:hypothetical protein C2W62_29230 [Candidatus Entotheonella serta]|nr:hypothetical protein C2W62_29230 [Candidatus Entotheonella serta]
MSATATPLPDIFGAWMVGSANLAHDSVHLSLPVLLWAGLLLVSSFHWRREHLPRERYLMGGFALGFASECVLSIMTALGWLGIAEQDVLYPLFHSVKQALSHTARVLIAMAFLQHLQHDAAWLRRFLWGSFGVMVLSLLVTVSPSAAFEQTWRHGSWGLAACFSTLFPLIVLWRKTRE